MRLASGTFMTGLSTGFFNTLSSTGPPVEASLGEKPQGADSKELLSYGKEDGLNSGSGRTMSGIMALTLTQKAWEEISRHAMEAFPEECCGVVLSDGVTDQARPLRNIQNQLHAIDPETYPRDATIAYAMEQKELESIIHEAETTGTRIKTFYHSHPGHEAYFSQEDRAYATPFGEPTYPESAQIVVSIYDRVVKRISAYAWAQDKKDFVEITLKKI